MDVEKREPEGCLTAAIRIPVRIVVLLVVLPVRVVWDALTVCGRACDRFVLRPLGRVLYALLVLPVVWLYAHVLAPLGRGLAWLAGALVTYGLVRPAGWLYRRVLTPVGRALRWLADTLVVVPARWLYRWGLAPLGRALRWLAKALLVWPWVALWRYVVVPVARYGVVVPLVWLHRWVAVPSARWLYRWVLAPVGWTLVMAWRGAGYVSRALWRALAWLGLTLLVRPLAWCYRYVCTPVGHALRDHLWRPVRNAVAEAGRATRAVLASAAETVRRARRDAWRALAGGPAQERAGEPTGAPARSLGSTTTAPGVAPASEISLRKRG
ncbi:hypothetical protein [Streptomyces lavendofoliae]|uniref:hypothetical protein n=1 Tax=Streptomyces lavendofoliae TaxID=67314 RepID=UPI003D91BC79